MQTGKTKRGLSVITHFNLKFTVFIVTLFLALTIGDAWASAQALRRAALEGQIEKVRASLDQGASPDARDADGRTALMMAAFNGHTKSAQLLMDRGAKVNVHDGVGRTALMYAAAGPNTQTVKHLIDHGANLDIQDTEEGFTALMFAAAEGEAEVIKVLLSHGANIKITDKDGDTALCFAKKNGHQEAVQELEKAMEGK